MQKAIAELLEKIKRSYPVLSHLASIKANGEPVWSALATMEDDKIARRMIQQSGIKFDKGE